MALLLPVLVATLATASPLGAFVTKQALPAVPQGFAFQEAAPADHKIDLHIRLKEQNLDKLEQRTLEVSDPTHRDYGKHLSKAEVDALVAPTKDAVDSVTRWLSLNGIDAGKVNSGYISVSVSVEQAKQLLNADYGVYTEASTGRQTVRTTSYSLPRDVLPHIAMVQPTTLFSDLGMSSRNILEPILASNIARAPVPHDVPACLANGTTSDCLRQNYNIKGYTPSSDGRTKLGITGFLEEVPDLNDLKLFLQQYDPQIPADASLKIESIHGGGTTSSGQGEANLDSQITVPLTYPLENVFYSVGGRPPFIPVGNHTTNDNEPYLDWLNSAIASDSPAQTYSISYGDDERTIPTDYIEAVCTQFLKLGARGVSILASSGDSGVGGADSCQADGATFKQFLPQFPASCPWVTAVGGTVNYGVDESVEPDGGSGFSNHFGTPHYQLDVVHTYIRRLKGQFSGLYNASGRAYPDVAASYNRFPIFYHGKPYRSGGTSASCPTVSSIIALLNDYLASKGKAPLGFLNPWLYKRGNRGFRDIAKGATNGCKTVPAFPSGEGWDAASGFGVPDFVKLQGLV